MRPVRSASGLAKWLLRIALFAHIFTLYFSTVKGFNFNHLGFYIAVIYLLFAALLIIGGFVRKHTLTVLSGLIILLLSVFEMFRVFNGNIISSQFIMYLLMASLGLFFLSKGNKS
jgi:hypothetical protein